MRAAADDRNRATDRSGRALVAALLLAGVSGLLYIAWVRLS